jgi:hypothetical protein
MAANAPLRSRCMLQPLTLLWRVRFSPEATRERNGSATVPAAALKVQRSAGYQDWVSGGSQEGTWYSLIADLVPERLAYGWLCGPTNQGTDMLGWMLVASPERASRFPLDLRRFNHASPPIPDEVVEGICNAACMVAKSDESFKAVWQCMCDLYKETSLAGHTLRRALEDIRDRFEGGAPLA